MEIFLAILTVIGTGIGIWQVWKSYRDKKESSEPQDDRQTTPKQHGSPTGQLLIADLRENTCLVGAEPWLRAIDERLRVGQEEIATQSASLVGQGGLGKTAMAREYARTRQGRYPGGVFWLTFESSWEKAIRDFNSRLTDHGLNQIQLEHLKVENEYKSAWFQYLNRRSGHKLIILDNLEGTELIRNLPLIETHVLITTRNQNLGVETSVQMYLPDENEALNIFLAYSGLNQAGLAREQKVFAKRITKQAYRLPLAIEILGRLARYRPWGELADGLDHFVSLEVDGLSHQHKSVVKALLLVGKNYGHYLSEEILFHLPFLYFDKIDPDVVRQLIVRYTKFNWPHVIRFLFRIGRNHRKYTTDDIQNALAALARFSVIKPGTSKGYSIHRLTQEAIIELDLDRAKEAEKAVLERLDEIVTNSLKNGIYQNAYPLTPHIEHMIELTSTGKISFDFISLVSFSWLGSWARESGFLPLAKRIFLFLIDHLIEGEIIIRSNLTSNLGLVLQEQGDEEEAERLFRQALKMAGKAFGVKHPNYAAETNNLALVLIKQGKYDEAEKYAKHTLMIARRKFGLKHPNYGSALNTMALVLIGQEKYHDAELFINQALRIVKRTYGQNHYLYFLCLNNTADLYVSMGDYKHARKFYQNAKLVAERTIGKTHYQYASLLHKLGVIALCFDEIESAIEMLAKAFAIRIEKLGPDHPDTKETRVVLDELK